MGTFDRLATQLARAAEHTPGERIDQARRAIDQLGADLVQTTNPSEHPDVTGATTRLRHASSALARALAHAHSAVAHLAAYADHIGVTPIRRDLPPTPDDPTQPGAEHQPGGAGPPFHRQTLWSRLPRWGQDGDDTTYGHAIDLKGNHIDLLGDDPTGERDHDTRSGHKREDRALIDAVHQRYRDRGIPFKPGNAHHAEQKLAAAMANRGIDEADLVINHPGGPCAVRLGCDEALPLILGSHQILRVHWRDTRGAWRAKTYGGRTP